MRFRGGYDIHFSGKPSGLLKDVLQTEILHVPLRSQSFHFSSRCVATGQRVAAGDVLAKDPAHYDVPLLSPCCGKVDVEGTPGHITLHELSAEDVRPYTYRDDPEHIHNKMGSAGLKRYKLLNLGAWEFIRDAYSGRMPDPLSTPQGIIVSMIHLEPFLVRGDVLLREYLRPFTRGLEHLQSLLEYQPIYLAFPKIKTSFAAAIKEKIRGYAWIKLIEVPLTYPYDHFAILSRHLGLPRSGGSVWGVNVEGVLAIDHALTSSRPCLERVISIAGPGAGQPVNVRLTAGYPIAKILADYAVSPALAIDGGLFTGRLLTDATKGVPADCRGITLIPAHQSREFLAFMRPGFDRPSYSGCFMSSLCMRFSERITDAVRGELRPCISCGFCQEVCPAGILPHQLHKLIYQDDIDAIERSRIDLCVECGLCSFVCPSKIELMQQFREMKEAILKEKALGAAASSSASGAEAKSA